MKKGKRKFTVKQIEEALKKTGGFYTFAAKELGCCYQTVSTCVRESPYLQKVKQEIEEEILDIAEIQLIKKIRKGNIGAISFYLKYKGKDRGYTERHEITGADGKEPVGVVLLPEKR